MENVAFYYSSKIGVNTGKGGAYYSLIAYRQELAKEYGTSLIHYKELNSETVLDDSTDVLLLPGYTFKQTYKILTKYFKENKPVAMFSFSGMPATLLLRWFCLLHHCKYIYVRAGGHNYELSQYFTNTIFYHKESFEFCQGERSQNTFILSNRVDTPKLNEQRVTAFTNEHPVPLDTLKILRVSRINNAYLPTFIAAVNQHKLLLQKGIKAVTHLIGFEEDAAAAEVIRKAIEGVEDIQLYTHDHYVINTKELIPFYDIVIGIGRGFWEGVACNKMVLGYAKNSTLPVLVTAQNIDVFMEFNCSARVELNSFDNFVDHLATYTDAKANASYKSVLKQAFDDHYSSEFLLNKLKDVIAKSGNETYVKFYKNFDEVFVKQKKANVKHKAGMLFKKFNLLKG